MKQAARELLWRDERFKIEGLVAEAGARLKMSERLTTPASMEILSTLRLGSRAGLADRRDESGV